MRAAAIWGGMLILLPLCSCLDVRNVTVQEMTPAAGSVIHLQITFDPPTTEGLEEGISLYGVLAVMIPQDWGFKEGTWTAGELEPGSVIILNDDSHSLSPLPGYRWLLLTSDTALSRSQIAGSISARISIITDNHPAIYVLKFLGGVCQTPTDITFSSCAPYRIEVTTY